MIRWIGLLCGLVSGMVFADNTSLSFTTSNMSFTPPPGDVSIGYLGNLFGVVDGVLFGSGSQIMAHMFAVFNSAVLALGGIVVLYIIIVSTMNTANEGEMLGHKWSSIWIPIRTTMGLALLIPKASGYCLMQIFVMWVVVQGVGVADKVWNAALDYLNRGGVIIHANMSPPLPNNPSQQTIAVGAANLLYSQVCMYGLQLQLQTLRNQYLTLANADSPSGPCAGTPSATMQEFCATSIPDFLSSVDPLSVDAVTQSDGTTQYSVSMPNIQSAPYNKLNGMCGSMTWTGVNTSKYAQLLSLSEQEVVAKTRSMAVAQLYSTLTLLAQTLVNNDPEINQAANPGNTSTPATTVAMEQYGVPYTAQFTPCTQATDQCPNWGADETMLSDPVLLQGPEFLNALTAYNAVMAPTLNLQQQLTDTTSATNARQFIAGAKTTGWMLAGSYFFNLVQLNGNAIATSPVDDQAPKVTFSFLNTKDVCDSGATFSVVCTYLNKTTTPISALMRLYNLGDSNLSAPALDGNAIRLTTSTLASTVYGYVGNGANLYIPPQAGTTKGVVFTLPNTDLQLPDPPHYEAQTVAKPWSFKVYKVKIKLNGISDMVNNTVKLAYKVYNEVVSGTYMVGTQIFHYVFVMPTQAMAYIFAQGMWVLQQPGVNPIVALAQMGVTYINYSIALAFALATTALINALNPGLYAVATIMLPLFITWMGITMSVAFITAYYVPFLPYMIFTFGTIAWLTTVIEAMVAAPIVALGVAHPEGHDAMGKSEAGLMILMNVFLRPVMMVIGYIAAIALSYVSVWIINAGFQTVLDQLLGTGNQAGLWGSNTSVNSPYNGVINGLVSAVSTTLPFSVLFGYCSASILYTSMYMTVVEKAFSLIATLPDTVLRWIGSQAEHAGSDTMQWSEASKGKIEKSGEEQGRAGAAVGKATISGAASGAKSLGSAASMTKSALGSAAGRVMSAMGMKGGDKSEDEGKTGMS